MSDYNIPRSWLRSSAFNIVFVVVSLICCLIFLPVLFMPRTVMMKVVQIYLSIVDALERSILNLRYEVRGREHLPKEGSYIVAAKHQSTYETLKLHMLFHDPAVVLKKQLFLIPLWGQFLKKADVIAIDRSSRDEAMRSIAEGAQRAAAQGRPIVIFPQGTRVHPEETPEQKPYKGGIGRMQEATSLPIVPMAINTGIFWPRSGWLKSSGTVIFEFHPPIMPGLERAELLKKLEDVIETGSIKLMKEAHEKEQRP